MELPHHVNHDHFNLMVRAVERRPPSSSDMSVATPVTFVSANFVVHEQTKPIRTSFYCCAICFGEEISEREEIYRLDAL
jgi:hypothetical protein